MKSARYLLLTLALAACGEATRNGSGVLVIAVAGDADNLFPPAAASSLARQVTDRIYPRLAELTASLNTVDDSGFTPSLAVKWEHASPTRLVFHLDPRAKWQDGVRLTAQDVVFSFKVNRDTMVGSMYPSNLASVSAVTALDSETVAVDFSRAYPEQLYDATYHVRVLPKHLLDTIPAARLASSAIARAPLGAGPYRFVKWADGQIELAADTSYWGDRAKIGRIIWRVMPDMGAAVSALIAGDADAMEVIPQREELERAERDSDLVAMPYPSPFLMFIQLNVTRPPFADRNLRRALAMAVDRRTMARAVFGPNVDVPVGATTRMQWISDGPVRELPYDTAAAAQLLDSLGWRRGGGPNGTRSRAGTPLRFALLVPTTSRIRQQGALLLQDQLRKAGIDMQIQPLDFGVFQQKQHAHAFDALFASTTLDASPSALVGDWTSAAAVAGGNFGGYRSAAFDSQLTAATGTSGKARAGALYREALGTLNDDAAALFLFSPRNTAVIHRRYRDVTLRADEWLATVAAWSVPADRQLPRDRIAPASAAPR